VEVIITGHRVHIHLAVIQEAAIQEAVREDHAVQAVPVAPVAPVVLAAPVEVEEEDNLSISNFQYQISKIDIKHRI
jgi:hypothetical protein